MYSKLHVRNFALRPLEECEGAYGGARIRNPEESDEEEDDDDFDDDEDFDDEDEDTEEEEDKEGFMNMLQNFLMSKLHLGSQEEVPKVCVRGFFRFFFFCTCRKKIFVYYLEVGSNIIPCELKIFEYSNFFSFFFPSSV